LGNHAIVRGAECAIIQLEFSLDDAPFESAYLSSPGLDVFFTAHGPHFEFLAGALFLLLGHPISGLRSIGLGTRSRPGARKIRSTFGIDTRISEPGFGRPQGCFPTSLFLRTLAGF
jgi:hypothetical protein